MQAEQQRYQQRNYVFLCHFHQLIEKCYASFDGNSLLMKYSPRIQAVIRKEFLK